MGMYTEILIKSVVKEGVAEEVLNYLFNNSGKEPSVLPDHKFFTLPRWRAVGSGRSHFHIPWSNSLFEGDYLFSRSDLKNYNEEIENFFDWFQGVSFEEVGDCIGYSWYEEAEAPTLIYKTR